MQQDPRPHIRRRRHAIDRLRSLSTGAAVAGIAGTAGFGAMAAMTWSGDPGATPLPASEGTAEHIPTATTRPTAPSTGFGQPPTVTTPRSNRATGGHASTGGSR